MDWENTKKTKSSKQIKWKIKNSTNKIKWNQKKREKKIKTIQRNRRNYNSKNVFKLRDTSEMPHAL